MALLGGLSLAVSHGLQIVCVECDVVNVINEVKSFCFDYVCGTLIEDVVELLALIGGGICPPYFLSMQYGGHSLVLYGFAWYFGWRWKCFSSCNA